MKTVTTRGTKVKIPDSIEELTPEQYEHYLMLAASCAMKLTDLSSMRVRWMSVLLGLGEMNYTMLKPQFIEEIDAQMGVLDGFFDMEAGDASWLKKFKLLTPKNLLPEYAGLKGPGDWLEGVTFGEFTKCITLLEDVGQESQDEIARTLYHIPNGGPVPPLLACHAPILLVSVWTRIQTAPIDINGQPIDFRIIFRPSGSRKADDKTGWTGITMEVAKEGLFGTMREVEATDFWEVLIYLYRCKFEHMHEQSQPKGKS